MRDELQRKNHKPYWITHSDTLENASFLTLALLHVHCTHVSGRCQSAARPPPSTTDARLTVKPFRTSDALYLVLVHLTLHASCSRCAPGRLGAPRPRDAPNTLKLKPAQSICFFQFSSAHRNRKWKFVWTSVTKLVELSCILWLNCFDVDWTL